MIKFFWVSGKKPKTCFSQWLQFFVPNQGHFTGSFFIEGPNKIGWKYVLWTARQHLRTFAKQDFQIKCLGKKAGMDSADAGWAPPAICGKSYLVSHQLRARKRHLANSNIFIVKWPRLFSRQMKEKETEWMLLFLGETIRMSRILQTSGNFSNQTVTSVLVHQQLKEAD